MKKHSFKPLKKWYNKIHRHFRDASHIARTLLVIAAGVGAITFSIMYLSDEAVATGGNNVVGGRALPIYCVETEAPRIALTFDAAWGNSK